MAKIIQCQTHSFMTEHLKLIFIHGVNDQKTNYSQALFERVIRSCEKKLKTSGASPANVARVRQTLIRHEVLWTEETLDRVNRYLQLQYGLKDSPKYGFLTRPVDPLAMQIMQYIKDKGDKQTGQMNILADVDRDIQRFFAQNDIGPDNPDTSKHAIFVAHSLGSVIAFDYVFCFREACRLDASVMTHSFITMGSPIPLFVSAMNHVDSDLTLPANVKRWVNILSPWDAIARTAKPYFRNIPIDERRVHTGFLPLSAHVGYWQSPKVASIIADEALRVIRPSDGCPGVE